MVYLAMGSTGNQWNGLCRLPFLRTLAEAESFGTYTGGGYWADANQLVLNQWQPQKGSSPFRLANQCLCFQGSDLGVLYARWQRDGWLRRGDNYGTQRKVKNAVDHTVLCEGDDGWSHQPTPKHPALIAQFFGYCGGYNFRYRLDGYDDLLDDQVDCACWDSRGNLIYSRQGVLTKLSLENIKRHQPGSVHDLEPLVEREVTMESESARTGNDCVDHRRVD